jgi:hypothetical protein
MKIFSNRARWIEQFLLTPMTTAKQRKAENLLQRFPRLREEVQWQKEAYLLVRLYNRKKIREQLEEIHQMLMSDRHKTVFQIKINQIFNSNENDTE